MEVLIFVAFVVVVIVLFNRTGDNQNTIERLKLKLDGLEQRLDFLERGESQAPFSQNTVQADEAKMNPSPPAEVSGASVPSSLPPPPPRPQSAAASVPSAQRDVVFEEIGLKKSQAQRQQKSIDISEFDWGKLPVWVGGVALAFAAVYLVKYSIDIGLLGPSMRLFLGSVFGFALLGCGHYIAQRPSIANARRISQALIGAGLVGLYVVIYAAVNLYGFLPDLGGLLLMTLVSGLAVVMAVRHGQPIAVFGLLGGLLAPALIGSTEPNAAALFSYLFLIGSGLLLVLIAQAWWLLAILTLIGLFCWSGIWILFFFVAADSAVLIFFGLALTCVILASTGRKIMAPVDHEKPEGLRKDQMHVLNFLAIAGGVLTVFWLSLKITLSMYDFGMLGVFSLALIALTYFQPQIYQNALWAKFAATLLLFLIWAQDVPTFDALVILGMLIVLYVALPTILMRHFSDPRGWAAIQVLGAIFLYVISYTVFNLPAGFETGFVRFWGILGLTLAGLAAYQAQLFQTTNFTDKTIQDHMVSIYCLCASAFISIGFAIELPYEYLAYAFSFQILATSIIYKNTSIAFLLQIMAVLAVVLIALYWQQISMFASVILSSLLDAFPSTNVQRWALPEPLLQLGLPAALVAISSYIVLHYDRYKYAQYLVRILTGIAVCLGLMALYYLNRDLYALRGGAMSEAAGFIMRGTYTAMLAVLGVSAYYLHQRFDFSFLKTIATFLIHAAAFRLLYFDLFLHNLYWGADQMVGSTFLLNGITLTYGGGLFLCLWVLSKNRLGFEADGFFQKAYGVLGFVLLFALVTFTTRHYFTGTNLSIGGGGDVELYSYSVVWLLTGIGLLACGLKADIKAMRNAAMIVVALVVLKVFLIDASNLQGLYRVLSFFGLGIALLGLSHFYTKTILKKGRENSGDET